MNYENLTNDEFILEISNQYYKPLFRYVIKICSNQTLAADIVQDTFLIAYEKADTLKTHKNVPGWLYQTARYRMLQLLDKALRYEEINSLADKLEDQRNYEEESIAILDLYPEMARHLDPRDIELLIRHYEQGYPYRELAKEYHTSEASLKVKVQRIRKKLQKHLRESYC